MEVLGYIVSLYELLLFVISFYVKGISQSIERLSVDGIFLPCVLVIITNFLTWLWDKAHIHQHVAGNWIYRLLGILLIIFL